MGRQCISFAGENTGTAATGVDALSVDSKGDLYLIMSTAPDKKLFPHSVKHQAGKLLRAEFKKKGVHLEEVAEIGRAHV